MTTREIVVMLQMLLLMMNWKLVIFILVRFLVNKSRWTCGLCGIILFPPMLLLRSSNFVEFNIFPSCMFLTPASDISHARKKDMRSRIIPVTEQYSTYFLANITCGICNYNFTGTWDLNSHLTTEHTGYIDSTCGQPNNKLHRMLIEHNKRIKCDKFY